MANTRTLATMLGMDFFGRLSGAGGKVRGDEGLNPGCVPREGEGTFGRYFGGDKW